MASIILSRLSGARALSTAVRAERIQVKTRLNLSSGRPTVTAMRSSARGDTGTSPLS